MSKSNEKTKNSVIIYTDCLEQLDYLSMEERGTLFTAILNYQAGLELPELGRELRLIFIPIRQQIDRSNEAYARKVAKNKANIEKRWGKNNQNNANEETKTANTNEYDGIQTNTNEYDGIRSNVLVGDTDTDTVTDTVTDTDKDTDTVTDTDTDKEKEKDTDTDTAGIPTTPTKARKHLHDSSNEPEDVEKIQQRWNAIPHTRDIRSIIPCTKRWNELILAFDMFGFDTVLEAVEKVAKSKYLQKRGGVNFDNFMNPNVIQRLIEGTYDEDFTEVNASDGLEFSC